jgi:hypothetical protein
VAARLDVPQILQGYQAGLELLSYCHMYACMVLYDNEADGSFLEARTTQEAADAVREDGRSGGRTHSTCD